jgi:hypothetical protein
VRSGVDNGGPRCRCSRADNKCRRGSMLNRRARISRRSPHIRHHTTIRCSLPRYRTGRMSFWNKCVSSWSS